jgi:hypothetical protein
MPCPLCGHLTLQPLSSTANARVDYYRCDACTHVWTTEKGSTVVLAHVTEQLKAKIHKRSA